MPEKPTATAHAHHLRAVDPPQHDGAWQLFRCECDYEEWRSTDVTLRRNPNAWLNGSVPKKAGKL